MIRTIGTAMLLLVLLPAALPGQMLSFYLAYGNGYHPVALNNELDGTFTMAFHPPSLGVTDASGTAITHLLLNHPGISQITDFMPSPNQGYYVAGHGADGLFLMEVNLNLLPIWFRTYGGVTARQVQQTPDGGFILCGEAAGSHKILLVKTNSVGVLQWSREVDLENGDEVPAGVARLKFGTYVVAGSILRNGQSNRQSFLLQFDNGGNVLRSQVLQTGNPQVPLDISPTTTGGFLVSGYSTMGGEDKAFVANFDSMLQPVWSRTIFPDSTGRTELVAEGNGRFHSVSEFRVGNDSLESRVWIQQWDELGNVLWTGNLGIPGINHPANIRPHNGALFVCGELPSPGVQNGFFHKSIPGFAEDCLNLVASVPTDTIFYLPDTLPHSSQAGPPATIDSVPYTQFSSIFTFFDCSLVALEPAEADAWTVFPNPANGSFRIQWPVSEGEGTIRLLDVAGRELWRESLDSDNMGRSYPLPDKSQAIYFLEIVSEKGRMVKKIVNQP